MEHIKRFKPNDNNTLYILFETGISAGLYINEYIHGNEVFDINDFVKSYKGTMLGSIEFADFVRKLKKYVSRVNYKVEFYGIDLEYQRFVTDKMLDYIGDLPISKAIKKNLKNTELINNYDDEKYGKYREKFLFQNFKTIIDYIGLDKDFANSNIIGFVGAWHVREFEKSESLAQMIRRILKKKVLSIETLYKYSRRTVKEDGIFKVVKVNDELEESNYKKFGTYYISKENDSIGTYLLSNCHSLKMLK